MNEIGESRNYKKGAKLRKKDTEKTLERELTADRSLLACFSSVFVSVSFVILDLISSLYSTYSNQ